MTHTEPAPAPVRRPIDPELLRAARALIDALREKTERWRRLCLPPPTEERH